MDVKKDRAISVQELVYLLSFSVLFGIRAIGVYEGQLLYNIALVVGVLIWGLKILMTEHSILEYVLIGGMLLLALIIYKNTGEKGLLLYFTMMLGMKKVKTKRVFKTGLGVLAFSFVILIILSLLGIKEEIFYMQKRGDVEMFRHALGYPHPNTLHTTYVILMSLVVYLLGKQNWKKLLAIYGALFAGSLYIYLYSGSRTGLLISAFYLTMNFYFQVRGKLSIFEKLCIYLVYPFCCMFSIIGPFVIKGALYRIVNTILNNRLMLSVYYLENEPITLLGTRFKEAPNSQYMIDSSFLYSFLQLGVIAFVILLFFYMVTIHLCIKEEKKAELAMIISFCIMGITDPFLFNLSYKNLGFIVIGYYFYQVIEKKLEPKDNFLTRSFLNTKIQILKMGNKELQLPFLNKEDNALTKGQVIKAVFIYVVTGVISTVIALGVIKEPKKIYVDEATWKYTARVQNMEDKKEWEEYSCYLTEEDVKKLNAEGNIVKNYQSIEEPMYMFDGTVARMEYLRTIISIGVWLGLAGSGGYIVCTINRKKENK